MIQCALFVGYQAEWLEEILEKKKLILLGMAFLTMGLLSFGALVVYTKNKDKVEEFRILPALGKAPSFTMTDARNQSFSSDSLAGKVWVADFFFTDCPGPCPTMGKNMVRVRDAAPIDDLHLVSISVNPTVDQPEKMLTYGKKFRADFDRWHFLTAPEDQVREVSVKGFKMGQEVIINHSTFFALVDREGIIRGYYDGTDDKDMDQLIKDLELLKI